MKVDIDNHIFTQYELPEVTFQHLSIEDIQSYRVNYKLPREFYCDNYHKVSSCCIGTVRGDLAYIHWIYYNGDYSRFLNIGNDCAEINYVMTLPNYRGQHLSTAALISTLQVIKSKGIKRVYAVVHNNNIASIKSFTRAGFAEVGYITSIGQINKKAKVQ